MTELCEVPASEIDMLVGSMANTLGSAGGFCAGTEEVVFHQRINGTSFVFSAALPAMLAVASSTAIQHLISQPSILSTLQENIRILRSILDHIESIYIPSDIQSPLIHIQIRSKYEKHMETAQEKHGNTLAITGPIHDGHDLHPTEQLRLLQAIVDDALEHGVFLIRHKKLTSINPKILETSKESRPSIRIAVSAAFTRKEMEKAGNVIKSSVTRLIGKRR